MTQTLETTPRTLPRRIPAGVVEVCPGVYCLPVGVSNCYLVAHDAASGMDWTLIDAGSAPYAARVRRVGEAIFGAPPRAILLTHAHFDHAGSLPILLRHWDVPVYAHPMEFPYLHGVHYPPSDPTVRGFFPEISRFMYASRPTFLPRNVEPLPEEISEAPHLPGWEIRFSPGHTPGHVSFFHPGRGILIAGDAVTTVHTDNPLAVATMRQEISHPPAYATYNWHHARQSARALAELEPSFLATGHGLPMSGPDLAQALKDFAAHFPTPSHGRYVHTPAKFNRRGPTFIPPKPNDLVKQIVLLGAGILTAVVVGRVFMKRR